MMWYLCLTLTIFFLCLTLRNSVGNVIEILDLLDTDTHTGIEIENNYDFLIKRWGEWEITTGASGLHVRYVNVGNALFSGLMITFSTISIICFAAGIIFGKIVFPLLAKHYKSTNDEMVDLATLKSASQINELSNKSKKEWF